MVGFCRTSAAAASRKRAAQTKKVFEPASAAAVFAVDAVFAVAVFVVAVSVAAFFCLL